MIFTADDEKNIADLSLAMCRNGRHSLDSVHEVPCSTHQRQARRIIAIKPPDGTPEVALDLPGGAGVHGTLAQNISESAGISTDSATDGVGGGLCDQADESTPVDPDVDRITKDLANTLAALMFGDTDEHISAMLAANPAWDQTRGQSTLAAEIVDSEWFSNLTEELTRKAVQQAVRQAVNEAVAPFDDLVNSYAGWYPTGSKTISVNMLREKIVKARKVAG